MAVAVAAGGLVGGAGRPAVLKRLLSTAVLLPAFLLIVVKAPAWLFNALVVLAGARASWELTRMLEQAGRPVQRRLGLLAAVVLTASFGASRLPDPLLLPGLVLALAVGAILAAPIWQSGVPGVESTANTLLAVMYVLGRLL